MSMSNFLGTSKISVIAKMLREAKKGTYDVLIFLGIVGYFRDCDRPTNMLSILDVALIESQ